MKLEELRMSVGLNQTDFAREIGLSFRGYQARLQGTRPNWKLDEIIKACRIGSGTIEIEMHGTDVDGTYRVTIQRID